MAADPDAPAVMRLSPRDNVAVALRALKAGEIVLLDGVALVIERHVAVGQRLAAQPIAAGEPVVKYHAQIGIAKQPIPPGALIRPQNFETDYRQQLPLPGSRDAEAS